MLRLSNYDIITHSEDCGLGIWGFFMVPSAARGRAGWERIRPSDGVERDWDWDLTPTRGISIK